MRSQVTTKYSLYRVGPSVMPYHDVRKYILAESFTAALYKYLKQTGTERLIDHVFLFGSTTDWVGPGTALFGYDGPEDYFKDNHWFIELIAS